MCVYMYIRTSVCTCREYIPCFENKREVWSDYGRLFASQHPTGNSSLHTTLVQLLVVYKNTTLFHSYTWFQIILVWCLIPNSALWRTPYLDTLKIRIPLNWDRDCDLRLYTVDNKTPPKTRARVIITCTPIIISICNGNHYFYHQTMHH